MKVKVQESGIHLLFAASIGAKEPVQGDVHGSVVAIKVLWQNKCEMMLSDQKYNLRRAYLMIRWHCTGRMCQSLKQNQLDENIWKWKPYGEAYGSNLHCRATGIRHGQARLPSHSQWSRPMRAP